MNWLNSAKEYIVRDYPEEACGLVVDDTFIPCLNRSEDPREGFEIDPLDFRKAVSSGNLEFVVHSHPDGPPYPTADDMCSQIETDVPWAIIPVYKNEDTVYTEDPVFFGDQLEIPPLLGRSFRHGVTDCFALMRDYYRLERGITVPEFPRTWGWWEMDGIDLYDSCLKECGFRDLLPGETPQIGDAFLACIRSRKMNHGGILLDHGRILHHPITSFREGGYDPGSLSREDSASRWVSSPLFRKFVRYDGSC